MQQPGNNMNPNMKARFLYEGGSYIMNIRMDFDPARATTASSAAGGGLGAAPVGGSGRRFFL